MADDPHDHLVRTIFGRPAIVAEELRAVVPSRILQALDLRTLQGVPGTVIDERLREREVDLLFTCRHRAGGRAWVYVLFEHQSGFDHWLPLRLLEYLLRVWQRFRCEQPRAKRLPRIVPVVLYHGDHSWRAPARFDPLLEDWPGDPVELECATLDFRFVIDDLTLRSDAELRARSSSALVTLTTLVLKHGRRSRDLGERIVRWAKLLDDVARTPGGKESLLLILRYLAHVSEHLEPRFLREKLLPILDPQVREMAMKTLAEKLRDEGRQEGRQEGALLALRRAAVELLVRRFGAIPDDVRARIDSAPLDQVEAWTARILDVGSPEDLVAE